MSTCRERFEDLTREAETVLEEDLEALRRLPEETRIERYNTLKANEQAFLGEFREACPDFLTESERARVRGEFRLARLLLAASFEVEGTLPRAMADEFTDAELQAVVDFDRYREFDALSESQIEERIRRMDGEVYELVSEYTSTQLATVDDLAADPDVRQDLLEGLLERYEERREKIRRGFFTYVETHGLEHMVEAIEEAVRAVNESATERERVGTELQAELEAVSELLDDRLERQRRELESRIREIEGELAGGAAGDARSETDRLEERIAEFSRTQESTLEELETRIERTADLESRLEAKIDDLEEAKARAAREATEQIEAEAAELLASELEKLREQREALREGLAHLERERERIRAERESLEERQETLESRLGDLTKSIETGDGDAGIEGENVVTAPMARLFEMDYLGRFDISMRETPSVRTREDTVDVPAGYWDGRRNRWSNRSKLVDLLDGEDVEQYPAGEAARYEMSSSRLFFATETEMVVEARVLADLEAYAANGFDTQPAGLEDLLAAAKGPVAEAEAGEYGYLLGLASPTGWTEEVREQVETEEFARTRFSRYVSVCLVDLQDGSVVYDESDSVARENADLFAPPVDAERTEECVRTVREEYVEDIGHETVLLGDVVDDHGYDAHVVKRAFNRIEEAGAGEQLYLDDLGLGLHVGT